MQPTTGPAHLRGLRGLGALGQSLGLTLGLGVPEVNLSLRVLEATPNGEFLDCTLRLERPGDPVGVSGSHPRAESPWISPQGWRPLGPTLRLEILQGPVGVPGVTLRLNVPGSFPGAEGPCDHLRAEGPWISP